MKLQELVPKVELHVYHVSIFMHHDNDKYYTCASLICNPTLTVLGWNKLGNCMLLYIGWCPSRYPCYKYWKHFIVSTLAVALQCLGVCKQWTGLLEWITGLDYWTDL